MKRSLTALSHCLAELSTLSFTDADTHRFRDWRAYTLRTLKELLGENAPALSEFEAIRFTPTLPAALEEQEHAWRAGRTAAYTLLTAARFQPYSRSDELDELETPI